MTTWPLVALGDIFDIARGGSPRPIQNYITDDPEGVNWIMISDASESSKYITSTKKRIRKEGVKNSRMVYQGDFLLTNSMSFGRPYIMQTSGCIHDGWLVLSNRLENVDCNYFFHLLGSNAVYLEFVRRAAGATVKNLNIDLVKGVQVPLPPLEEQKRIAEILDRAEELRSKRREAIAQLDTLTQAIFFEMFNNPANKFDTTTIKEVASKSQYALSSGPFGSNLTSKHYVDDGVPVLRGLNVTGNRLSLEHLKFINEEKAKDLARSQVKPGDVVVVAVGSSGLAYQIPSSLPRAIMSQNFNKITPDLQKVNATYLTFCINTSFVQNQISQNITDTVRTFLSLTKLKTVKIPLPSLSLQQEFADRVEAVEKLKAAHRASLSELDALFASLQHRAFRGEL